MVIRAGDELDGAAGGAVAAGAEAEKVSMICVDAGILVARVPAHYFFFLFSFSHESEKGWERERERGGEKEGEEG